MKANAQRNETGAGRARTSLIRRGRARRVVATSAVLALVSGALLSLAATPAAAAQGTKVVNAGGAVSAGGGVWAADGYSIDGVLGYGDTGLAPMVNPNGGAWLWCIQAGADGVGSSGDMVLTEVLYDQNSRAMNELLRRIQYDPASLAFPGEGALRDPRLSVAAVSFLMHVTYDEGFDGTSAAERRQQFRDAAWPALAAEADRLWALAQVYGASGSPSVERSVYRIPGSMLTGDIHDIGFKVDSTGAWVAGIAGTAYLTGAAVFDKNRNGVYDPGVDTGVWNITTENGPLTLPWVATGAIGDATFHVVYQPTPGNLAVIRAAAGTQDTVSMGADDPALAPSVGVTFTAAGQFQPTATSVAVKEITDGVWNDEFTVSTENPAVPWLDDVPATFHVDVYGPLTAADGAQQNTIPAGTPLAGSGSFTVTGPGSTTVQIPLIGGANAPSGAYTAVASFRVEDQPTEYQGSFVGDWFSPFYEAAETGYVPMTMDLSSALSTPKVSKGEQVVDRFTLAPANAGGLWISEGGVPVAIAMKAELSEPVSEAGQTVPGVQSTIRFVADHYGTYVSGTDTPDLGTTATSGVRSVRLSVDTENLTDQARRYLADAAESATDGWWAPDEAVTTRMRVAVATVTTKDEAVAAGKYDQRGPFDQDGPTGSTAFVTTDTVDVTLEDPDDLWLTDNGEPVGIDVDNTCWGMYANDNPPASPSGYGADDKVIVVRHLTFTGPGSQTADCTTTGVGYATWTSQVEQDTDWYDAYSSGWWEPAETMVVRAGLGADSALSPKATKTGSYMVDEVWIDGFPEGHPAAGEAKSVTHEMWFFPKGIAVDDAMNGARSLGVLTTPAVSGYVPSLGALRWKASEEGTYVVRTCFPGDARTAPYCSSATDRFEQYTGPKTGTGGTLSSSAGDVLMMAVGVVLVALGAGGGLLLLSTRRQHTAGRISPLRHART